MSNRNQKRKVKKGGMEMAIMTADCKRAFVVDPEKAVQFKAQKCSKRTVKKISEATKKISKNINAEDKK